MTALSAALRRLSREATPYVHTSGRDLVLVVRVDALGLAETVCLRYETAWQARAVRERFRPVDGLTPSEWLRLAEHSAIVRAKVRDIVAREGVDDGAH